MTAITRSPKDGAGLGYFVSDWYGVRVAWQGANMPEPRMLMPWEFIRADDRNGTVDFLNGTPTAEPVPADITKASGDVKIHVAESASNCKCRNLMMDAAWWVLGTLPSEKVYHYDHPLFLPYTPAQKQDHVGKIEKWRIDRLKAAGLQMDRIDLPTDDHGEVVGMPRTDAEIKVIRKALLGK